jgi:FkbM family methyltransferase
MTLRKDRKEGDFFTFLDLIQSKEGILLDVGANIGIMSVHMAKKFTNRTVLAIEPMPDNIGVYRRVLDYYTLKNVEFHEVAVGQDEGFAKMILPLNGATKEQGLSHVVHESITEWNVGQTFEVKMNTIDQLVGDRKVAAIKLDVENFEYFALLGALECLKRDHPILYLELWENDNRANCFQLLLDLGYKIYIAENGKLVEYKSDLHLKQNFIFLSN